MWSIMQLNWKKTAYTTGLIVKQADFNVNPVIESLEHFGLSFKRRVVDKEDIKCDKCDYKYNSFTTKETQERASWTEEFM